METIPYNPQAANVPLGIPWPEVWGRNALMLAQANQARQQAVEDEARRTFDALQLQKANYENQTVQHAAQLKASLEIDKQREAARTAQGKALAEEKRLQGTYEKARFYDVNVVGPDGKVLPEPDIKKATDAAASARYLAIQSRINALQKDTEAGFKYNEDAKAIAKEALDAFKNNTALVGTLSEDTQKALNRITDPAGAAKLLSDLTNGSKWNPFGKGNSKDAGILGPELQKLAENIGKIKGTQAMQTALDRAKVNAVAIENLSKQNALHFDAVGASAQDALLGSAGASGLPQARTGFSGAADQLSNPNGIPTGGGLGNIEHPDVPVPRPVPVPSASGVPVQPGVVGPKSALAASVMAAQGIPQTGIVPSIAQASMGSGEAFSRLVGPVITGIAGGAANLINWLGGEAYNKLFPGKSYLPLSAYTSLSDEQKFARAREAAAKIVSGSSGGLAGFGVGMNNFDGVPQSPSPVPDPMSQAGQFGFSGSPFPTSQMPGQFGFIGSPNAPRPKVELSAPGYGTYGLPQNFDAFQQSPLFQRGIAPPTVPMVPPAQLNPSPVRSFFPSANPY